VDQVEKYSDIKISDLIAFLNLKLLKKRDELAILKQEMVNAIQGPYQSLLDDEAEHYSYSDTRFCSTYAPSLEYVSNIKENGDFYKEKLCPILSEITSVRFMQADNDIQESFLAQRIRISSDEMCCVCEINDNDEDNLIVY